MAAIKKQKTNRTKIQKTTSIDKWIADFYCHEKKLVIELDGEIHNDFEIKEKDEGRTFEVEQLGITVVRFTNDEVINNIEKILQSIIKIANNL